jgi:carbamoyltransferase
MEHAYWGPSFDEPRIVAAIASAIETFDGRPVPEPRQFDGLLLRRYENTEALTRDTATALASGEVVGWYQGRSEWGPRALGNRSILADPRRPEMREVINARVKRRESFRPFGPSILQDRVQDYFEESYPDPFMMKVYAVRQSKREEIPAVTHVDGSGRLHTVSRAQNERYWLLLKAFEEITGVPLLLNTSFNVNEPIVNTPEEGLRCFLRTNMDRLILGNWMIQRCANRESSEHAMP